MSDIHDTLRCPQCKALMQTGFLPISQGMHFIPGDGRAAHHFAQNLPGTFAVMRTNRLLAWRCKACDIAMFKYGRDNAKRVERLLAQSGVLPDTEPTDAMDEDDAAEEKPRR